MKPARLLRFLSAAAFGLALTGSGAVFIWTSLPSRGSQGPIKVGAIYPLSTSTGTYAKAGIVAAEEIINNPHPDPELGDLLFAKGGGLTGLGGARIKVVWKNSNEKPGDGETAARDLIMNEKVVALIGAYNSPVTKTASAVAEDHGIPFLNGESVADPLTERGFKWFFRTTPVAADFARMYAAFLKDMREKRCSVDNIAIVHEDGQYGVSVASIVTKTFKENGLKVTIDIPYATAATERATAATERAVEEAVQQLKNRRPDVVMFMSYTDDAILFANKMAKLRYKPPITIADEAGFTDPNFIRQAGKIVEGMLIRSSWSADAQVTPSVLVKHRNKLNEKYKTKSKADLDSATARSMQGFFVLADAINRAASISPVDIRAALKNTDLEPKQLIASYDGVKFDHKGQNIKASVLLTELKYIQNDQPAFVPVWPKPAALPSCERW